MIQTSLPVSGQLHTIPQELAMFLLDFVGASLTSRLSVVLSYETVLHVTLSSPLELVAKLSLMNSCDQKFIWRLMERFISITI